MQHAVQDGRLHAGIVVEDAGPVLVGLVGRDDRGAPLIALTDDLEDQIGAGLIQGQIP